MASCSEFNYGHFVLLNDHLLELVQENKILQSNNAFNISQLDNFKAEYEKLLTDLPEKESVNHQAEKSEYLLQIEKALKEKSADVEFLNTQLKTMVAENEYLHSTVSEDSREKIALSSKLTELESKLSVHSKQKETCLLKTQELSDTLMNMTKNSTLLISKTKEVEEKFKEAMIIQQRLMVIENHNHCIINTMKSKLDSKDKEIILLKKDLCKQQVHPSGPCKSKVDYTDVHVKEIKEIEAKLNVSLTENSKLSGLLESNKQNMVEFTRMHDSTLRDQESKLSELRQEISTLETQNSNLEDRNKELRRTILIKDAALIDKSNELKSYRDKICELQSEISVLKDLVVESEGDGKASCDDPADIPEVDSSIEISFSNADSRDVRTSDSQNESTIVIKSSL